MQSRYYNPEVGRFINADNYPTTGQGLLGNNMFIYCLNNPVRHIDPSGELAYFGEIHDAVSRHIASKYSLRREQRVITKSKSRARADLISETGEVWDVKRCRPRQIAAGKKQVKEYAEGVWARNPNVPLKVGHSPIEQGSFHYKSGLTTYRVSYYDAGDGVIAYDYSVCDFDTETATQMAKTAIIVIVAAVMAYFGVPVAA